MCDDVMAEKIFNNKELVKELNDLRERMRAIEDHLKIRVYKPYGYQVKENKDVLDRPEGNTPKSIPQGF